VDAPHLVVIGAGFGGLALVRALRRSAFRITLIDRQNHHLFQPLLYQVATAGLAPGDIAEPIRRIVADQRNVSVRLGEVTRVDRDARQVFLGDQAIGYDVLCVATGATHHYFGHDDWAAHAPGLKTIADALDVRRRILTAFERAEWTDDPDERRALLSFVVVGGGPTGVELAGAIREIATKTLRREFRAIDPVRDARVVLVEAGAAVLGTFPDPLPARAKAQLEGLGVQVRVGEPVERVDADGVLVGGERIVARTVLWAAGVRASPLGAMIGAEVDRSGRVSVGPDLSIDGGTVFVIGDLARVEQGGAALPAVAPVAIQMGKYVARRLTDARGRRLTPPFRYRDVGSMATIGRSRAIASVAGLSVAGPAAWVLWVFVHLMTLVGHRNRLVVFIKWAWAYLTWESSSRLVWGDER
jgi:NADH:ubiquinone reductase (H+-translocating)